ncbi:inositol polyphosphate kinase family protein [Bordetella flabilis]|uniref:Uncharacterized protein n=1 Tax=Bordetella flabilis TaxID=463014 RepID=A0A193GF00_9BORD|nr:hypothetical protein BAU07_17280 [Bordetella flabilis]
MKTRNTQVNSKDPTRGGGAAGHAQSFAVLSDTRLAKRTTVSEAEAYERFGPQLQGALCQDVLAVWRDAWAQTQGLNSSDLIRVSALLKSARLNERVIVFGRIGADIPEHRKIEIDLKIGQSTASRHELMRAGHPHPTWKKIKHTAMDYYTGSRALHGSSRGFRVEGVKVRGRKIQADLLHRSEYTDAGLTMALAEVKDRDATIRTIVALLASVRSELQTARVGFIGSSIFIAIDVDNPARTQVKLIDLAHPVLDAAWPHTYYLKVKQRLDEGMCHLIDWFAINGSRNTPPHPRGRA